MFKNQKHVLGWQQFELRVKTKIILLWNIFLCRLSELERVEQLLRLKSDWEQESIDSIPCVYMYAFKNLNDPCRPPDLYLQYNINELRRKKNCKVAVLFISKPVFDNIHVCTDCSRNFTCNYRLYFKNIYQAYWTANDISSILRLPQPNSSLYIGPLLVFRQNCFFKD